HVMTSNDEQGAITYRLGGLVRHISVPKFGAALDLYTDEFMSVENFFHLHRHIHNSYSYSWTNLMTSTTPYDASCSM
ncbi:hypothetical protein J1N35_034972, partial [Gossypium stocksii]